MIKKPARHKDRRQVNARTHGERRGTGSERRLCPECKGALTSSRRVVAGGSVTTLTCVNCDWTQSSRQTDSDVLMAKMTWALELERKAGAFHAAFPAELAEALKIKAGDALVLTPLTLPVGSLPMRWALTLKRKNPGKR